MNCFVRRSTTEEEIPTRTWMMGEPSESSSSSSQGCFKKAEKKAPEFCAEDLHSAFLSGLDGITHSPITVPPMPVPDLAAPEETSDSSTSSTVSSQPKEFNMDVFDATPGRIKIVAPPPMPAQYNGMGFCRLGNNQGQMPQPVF